MIHHRLAQVQAQLPGEGECQLKTIKFVLLNTGVIQKW